MGLTAAMRQLRGRRGLQRREARVAAVAGTLRLELNRRPVRVFEIAPGMVGTDEFSTVRFRGDDKKAATVYEGVAGRGRRRTSPHCVTLAVGLRPHVDVDLLAVRPLAQAAQHKVFRGPLFS